MRPLLQEQFILVSKAQCTSCSLDLISDDARVPAEFRQDREFPFNALWARSSTTYNLLPFYAAMNYTGKLRIATGIALLNAFTETVDNAGFTKTRELCRVT